MRTHAPFLSDDLEHLDGLLDLALQVVPMREVYAGNTDHRVIGMRHDVDNFIEPAVEMAAWENERGYRSTYFILHSAPYWEDKRLLRSSVAEIAAYGHEVGIHNAALSEAVRDGTDPRVTLAEAILELRAMGHTISGTVAHGAAECRNAAGRVVVVNDEMFTECARSDMGPPDRTVGRVNIRPTSLKQFGLDYDANWLPRGAYISDSGGAWSTAFDPVRDGFPFTGQLHMLVHPDWWAEAFERVEVPAA
jgi:hypothetical protein